MHGHSSAGEMVRLRHEPHHYHRVELYDADTLTYRGPAFRSDEMSPRQARALRNARRREADRYAAKARRARKNASPRYAATSVAAAPEPLNRLTASQAAAQLRELQTPEGHLQAEARPDLLNRPQPDSARWTKPRPHSKPQDTE
ncbi:hypothetical protein RFN58_00205 [Streptomyces iakyrus]|uniref:hypothetical protein n=1 Tax=Streptomyces iakyrus TaxID=68219 RepID=UPI001FD83ADD|nr:hypothetical protein [Streptomyces iakyrus]